MSGVGQFKAATECTLHGSTRCRTYVGQARSSTRVHGAGTRSLCKGGEMSNGGPKGEHKQENVRPGGS